MSCELGAGSRLADDLAGAVAIDQLRLVPGRGTASRGDGFTGRHRPVQHTMPDQGIHDGSGRGSRARPAYIPHWSAIVWHAHGATIRARMALSYLRRFSAGSPEPFEDPGLDRTMEV
jgi:hypothetical protein